MISNASINDIDFIFKISSEFTDYFKSTKDISKIINSKFDEIFVYKIGETVVGFVHILNCADTVDLINIGVFKEYRQQKIGLSLIKYVIQYCINYNKNSIFLEVKENNDIAINFYKKNNFDVIYIRKNYYKDETNCLVMKNEVGDINE